MRWVAAALALTAGVTFVDSSARAQDPSSDIPDERSSAPARPAGSAPSTDPQCTGDRYATTLEDATDAAALMRGALRLPSFPSWQLPGRLSWAEDPFENDVWTFNYHSLRWLDVLRREGLRTGNQAMLDRYAVLWQDWLADNGSDGGRSPMAWYPMVAAVRSIGLACAGAALGDPSWVSTAISRHAAALLDPRRRGRGNHRLHQDLGLLALGCRTGNTTWQDTAVSRATAELPELVDSEGVSIEGSLQYQALIHRWYRTLQARMLTCGLDPDPKVFARVALMPQFLGHATYPDATMVAWGDTSAIVRAAQWPGSVAEYPASLGASGERPQQTFALYRNAGYAFSRSAWFDQEDADEQSLAAMRFGPALASTMHGHEDAGAVSFFGAGRQILWQPGLYAYGAGHRRSYVRSNEAHNVIDIAGARYDRAVASTLTAARSTAAYDLVGVRTAVLAGATWRRTMVHFKELNVLLVDDRVDQRSAREVRQNWHFAADRKISRTEGRVATSGPGSDATMVWVGEAPRLRLRRGSTDPMLGWRSEHPNQFGPAPTVQAVRDGRHVRMTALIVPHRSTGPSRVEVLRFATSATGRTVDIAIGEKKYRIRFSADSASIRRI